MRKLFLSLIMMSISYFNYAQIKSENIGSDSSAVDMIFINEINGIDVFATDTFNMIVQNKLKNGHYSINDNFDHPNVYFRNKVGNRYLKITGGPDLGYGWFYTIGYTQSKKCETCGTYLDSDAIDDFVINNGIKLGVNLEAIWEKVHLNFFRRFKYRGVEYFYFEKGDRQKIPFIPDKIFYYKFKNNKLIEIGFGYGMAMVNPMFNEQ